MIKLKNIAIFSALLVFPFFANAQGWNPGMLGGFGLPSGSIYFIIQGILYWLLGIFGFLAVIGFVVSGIMYIVSVGDDDTIKKAKSYMLYCIIGVIVALSGLVIIYAINSALRGYSSSF